MYLLGTFSPCVKQGTLYDEMRITDDAVNELSSSMKQNLASVFGSTKVRELAFNLCELYPASAGNTGRLGRRNATY